jgi:hypothetical protein
MSKRTAPFSNEALMAEFVRINGSGRPEDAIRTTQIRLQLIDSIRRRLRAKPAPRRRTVPAIDLKRRQANDID